MNALRKQENQWIIYRFAIVFFLGLIMGILFVNIAWPYRSSETDIFTIYLIEQLKKDRIPSKDYFLYLLEWRANVWILAVVLGLSNFAGWICQSYVALLGLMFGGLGCMCLLLRGMKGMIFVILANFPQMLFYMMAVLMMYTVICHRKGTLWNKNLEQMKEYVFCVILSSLVYFMGIVLEAFGNPYVLQLLTKCLQL